MTRKAATKSLTHQNKKDHFRVIMKDRTNITERLKEAYRASFMHGGEEKARLLELLREHAVEHRRAYLVTGKRTDIYFDCRRITLLDEGVHVAASSLLRAIAADDVSPAAVAGPVFSGVPLATAISLIRRSLRLTALAKAEVLTTSETDLAQVVETLLPSLPALAVRLKFRGHGFGLAVEGLTNVQSGALVALVDDVATTGSSLLNAIRILRKNGLQTAWVGCLIDREEGAREHLAEAGYELRALFTAQEVLDGRA